MQDILTCAMGLDVHRDVIVACLARGELGTEPEIEIRSFSTLIPEMRKLRDWVLEVECRHVAMESTGIYWQPIYEMLEPCFDGQINILVVNARHMKNVPGRKTDIYIKNAGSDIYPLRANTMLPALKYKPDQRVQCEKPHAQTIRSAFR